MKNCIYHRLETQALNSPPKRGNSSLACFHFPQKHRKRIRTTNALERLNREIKRRADLVQIFPNQEACQRLIGALCMEWSDEWVTSRRYLDMTDLKQNH
ncbi:MAG: hypothetical protein F4Y79_07795 [Gemmatimonadetes bacterium]|nr:hypothetical protein [Gemmatimonadota bacterium]MYD61832.1 hypothetical protein [Gemmatimonadota bacterium]